MIITWGIWFFTHKDFDAISRLSGYIVGAMVLSSISFGAASFYGASGMVGGLIAGMFKDFLGIMGTAILLGALWLVLIRGYFGFSYYHPIRELLSKLKKKQEEKRLVTEEKSIENEKRRHTRSLISKIDAQRSEENENVDLTDKKINEGESATDTEIIESKEESDKTDSKEGANEEGVQEEQDNDTSKDQHTNVESIDSIDDSNSENIETFSKNSDIEVGEVIEEEQIDLDEVQERKTPKKAYQLPSPDILDLSLIHI